MPLPHGGQPTLNSLMYGDDAAVVASRVAATIARNFDKMLEDNPPTPVGRLTEAPEAPLPIVALRNGDRPDWFNDEMAVVAECLVAGLDVIDSCKRVNAVNKAQGRFFRRWVSEVIDLQYSLSKGTWSWTEAKLKRLDELVDGYGANWILVAMLLSDEFGETASPFSCAIRYNLRCQEWRELEAAISMAEHPTGPAEVPVPPALLGLVADIGSESSRSSESDSGPTRKRAKRAARSESTTTTTTTSGSSTESPPLPAAESKLAARPRREGRSGGSSARAYSKKFTVPSGLSKEQTKEWVHDKLAERLKAKLSHEHQGFVASRCDRCRHALEVESLEEAPNTTYRNHWTPVEEAFMINAHELGSEIWENQHYLNEIRRMDFLFELMKMHGFERGAPAIQKRISKIRSGRRSAAEGKSSRKRKRGAGSGI